MAIDSHLDKTVMASNNELLSNSFVLEIYQDGSSRNGSSKDDGSGTQCAIYKAWCAQVVTSVYFCDGLVIIVQEVVRTLKLANYINYI